MTAKDKELRRLALAHLHKDKKLSAVISTVGDLAHRKDLDLYLSLMRAIVGQQLSVKAAQTIWGRFLGLFPSGYPEPNLLLALEDKDLRAVGLSFQKAGYLRNIAKFSVEQTLDYRKLKKLDDEALIEYLTSIKGVGRWTVEMILMFSLQRPDVFPVDDLGIQNGMIRLYKIRSMPKKQLYAKLQQIAESWRPHRTLGCMYIWRYKDATPLQKEKRK